MRCSTPVIPGDNPPYSKPNVNWLNPHCHKKCDTTNFAASPPFELAGYDLTALSRADFINDLKLLHCLYRAQILSQ
jgi:hypothetical protein